jgi:hypothetical protein
MRGQGIVGFGPSKEDRQLGIGYLDDLVKLSGGRGIAFDKVKDLSQISTRIVAWLKNEYLITIKPAITNKVDTRLPLRVIVNKPNLTVLAKSSYLTL